MRTLYLILPRMNISLIASEEILEKISVFYLFNVSEEKPPFITHAYRVETEGQNWIVSKDGQVLDRRQSDWESVFVLEYDIELSILEHRGNWLAIHAGCVAIGDEACLIAGSPESGKTTTTFNLVEMGHRFMCEEIAFLDAETKEVHPYLQTLSLESRFIDLVKQHFQIKRGNIHTLNPSLVRYLPETIQKESVKLSTIVVPKHDPKAEAEIIPLNPGGFLTEFLGYCFEPKIGMEDLVDKVISVLSECSVYRVVYGDVRDCRRMLLSLFPSASS